jgi:hypothetical protein
MTAVVRIPLNNGEIQAVDVDGKPFAIFRPIVESIAHYSLMQLRSAQARSGRRAAA